MRLELRRNRFISRQRMQRKALNYSADDTAFRRRIRTQPLLEASKESQQLGNHDKYDRSVVVSEFAEPTTLNHFIAGARSRLWDIFADDYFTEP